MTFDTTTIILIVLIAAGLVIMLLGLRAQRKGPPRTERKLGEDGSPYVASQERPYMAPPPPPAPVPAPACRARGRAEARAGPEARAGREAQVRAGGRKGGHRRSGDGSHRCGRRGARRRCPARARRSHRRPRPDQGR